MLSPNHFFIAGSDLTVAFHRENTFDDSVFGCAGSAAGLDIRVGGAVTFISGTMVLLPGIDATADVAAEGDGTWEDLSCDGRFASFFSPSDFVARELEDLFCGLGCGANCFVFSIIVSQIEEVLVDSCFIFVPNDIKIPSLDVIDGVNKGKVVAGVSVSGVLVAGVFVEDLVTENLEPAIQVLLLGIHVDGRCEAISWKRSYSAYVLPCTDAVLGSSRCQFLTGVVLGI
jgi:hypothetical protein